MSTTVTYKGNTLATVANNTKTLKTAGKYMEGDVVLTDVSGGSKAISVVDTLDSHGGTIRTITAVDISDTTAVASDVAQGKYFYTSDGTKTAGTSSGSTPNIQPLSVTQNGTYTASGNVDGYSPITVNVSGGGGIGTLLKTQTLGKISTSSTNATDTGLTVSVSDINSYDLLVVETSVDSVENNGHNATVNLLYLINEADVSTKNAVKSIMGAWNCKITSGTASTRYNTTSYGVYTMNASISNGDITWQVYERYNSTQTGAISANYTTRVYGIKLYDLIGG